MRRFWEAPTAILCVLVCRWPAEERKGKDVENVDASHIGGNEVVRTSAELGAVACSVANEASERQLKHSKHTGIDWHQEAVACQEVHEIFYSCQVNDVELDASTTINIIQANFTGTDTRIVADIT